MTEKEHTKIAKDLLVGKTIKDVVYLSTNDANHSRWFVRPVMIIFDDKSVIIPMRDDEGNDGGALHYYDNEKSETIGVLWND